MITNFNKYNLIKENTTLSSINIPNKFIKYFYRNSTFIIKEHNLNINQLTYKDIENKTLQEIFSFKIIDDDNIKSNILIRKFYNEYLKRYTYNFFIPYVSNINNKELFYLINESTFDNVIGIMHRPYLEFNTKSRYVNTEDLYFIIKDVIIIRVKYENFDNVSFLYKKFLESKKDLFIKIYTNFENIIQKKLEIATNKEFIKEMNNDLLKLKIFKKNIISLDDFNRLENVKLNKHNIFIRCMENNELSKVINLISLDVFKFHNKSLNYYRYIILDKKLEKDINYINQIHKDTIFDEDFIKKWYHIFNATNFDLV